MSRIIAFLEFIDQRPGTCAAFIIATLFIWFGVKLAFLYTGAA